MAERILVVEDEQDLRDLLVYNLREAGFEPVPAPTGGEALSLAESVSPDLVLLDMMLPDQPGSAVCRELRRHPTLGDVPIIIVSARGDEIDRVVGFELGADDYVVKPFSPRELMLRVRAVLARAAVRPVELRGTALCSGAAASAWTRASTRSGSATRRPA